MLYYPVQMTQGAGNDIKPIFWAWSFYNYVKFIGSHYDKLMAFRDFIVSSAKITTY